MFYKQFFKTTLSLILILSISTLVACSNEQSNNKSSSKITLRLVTYNSFPTKDTDINAALDQFEATSGIKVEIVRAGDAGTMVSKAVLTSGRPEGDVIFGIDNTLVYRAQAGNIFTPHTSKHLDKISASYKSNIKNSMVTPIDYGDVCINYDIDWFKKEKIDPPRTLEDLTKPDYAGLLAVEDPSTSSPGLAFLLATIERFGQQGYKQYWKDLKKSNVKVSSSWDDAYYQQFSGSSGKGDYPLVVSYATSPAAEVLYSETPLTSAPTKSIADTCFRQIEYAGVLRGTKHKKQAGELIDFLLTENFQKAIPLSLFVYPIRGDIALPSEFEDYSPQAKVDSKLTPSQISKKSEDWIDTWTQIVLR